MLIELRYLATPCVVLSLMLVLPFGSSVAHGQYSALNESSRADVLRPAVIFGPLSDRAPQGNVGMFVGVNRFTQDEGLEELDYAVHDAIELAHLFVFELNLIPASNCYLMVSGDPTAEIVSQHLTRLRAAGARIFEADRARILWTFLELKKAATTKDNLFVCTFCSHGFNVGRSAYVMPVDGHRELLSETAVPLESIELKMEQSRAGHRLLLVDACQERVSARGSSGAGIPTDPAFFAAFRNPSGQATLASCSPGEFSFEHASLGGVGHGLFTWSFLEALRGGATPPEGNIITLGAVATYVGDNLKALTTKLGRPNQTPFLKAPLTASQFPLAAIGKNPVMENGNASTAKRQRPPTRQPKNESISDIGLTWIPPETEVFGHIQFRELYTNNRTVLELHRFAEVQAWLDAAGVKIQDLDSVSVCMLNITAIYPESAEVFLVIRSRKPFDPVQKIVSRYITDAVPIMKAVGDASFLKFREKPEFSLSPYSALTCISLPEPGTLLLGSEATLRELLSHGSESRLPKSFDPLNAGHQVLFGGVANVSGETISMLPVGGEIFDKDAVFVGYGISIFDDSHVSSQAIFRFADEEAATGYSQLLGTLLPVFNRMNKSERGNPSVLDELALTIVDNHELRVDGIDVELVSEAVGPLPEAFREAMARIISMNSSPDVVPAPVKPAPAIPEPAPSPAEPAPAIPEPVPGPVEPAPAPPEHASGPARAYDAPALKSPALPF